MKGHYIIKEPKTIRDWLSQHGDRTEKDLIKHNGNYFVKMGSGNRQYDSDYLKVWLPENLTKTILTT
jgi:hypothetical protein